MSDVNANIKVNLDTSEALAEIKNLQRQISLFQQEMARSGSAANKAAARGMQSTLVNNLNATGQFRAQIKTIQSETEHFTEQLEKNKLSVGQYFRYAGASTKSFGKLWKSEFQTIEKVAIERVKTLQTQYIKLGRDANGALKSIAVRPLALDMNNLATKTAIAAQKQQLLNQLLKQGSTAMLNWGKNTQWAGRQLMVGFTIPLAMAGTAAAKAYIEFEKAAIKFKRVYGDFNTASADVDKMANSIKGLAQEYTKYGVAVADTMNMAADAAAMGKTGADLLAQVSQSARLAVLGNVDQAQSLETLTSLTNTFGIAADKLATNIDFLNAVENQTVTSIEDLTEAIPKAAPVIQQLGGDVKDLTYFLTAMKEGGINASEGANAIKSGLASIINPTKAATDMLNGYGISITAIRDAHADDVSGMVQDLAVQLDKLAPMDRARAIETLFGKFQFARMSTMFQNIARDGSQANKVLETAKMSTEELAVLSERELKKIEQSPAFKFEKALKDIQAKLIPVGEAFLKAVTPIVEWVGKILDSFNNMGDGAKQFLTMATIAVAGIGPVALMTFGLIANGVANLIKMFAGIKSFFNNTSGGTKTLGDTTEYMTQKELEAQAVASSLEQSHAKLTQQFTVQASAIRNLTEEYERAIGAQTRMLGGMSQMGVAKGTPGFSTGGTVRGPGGPTDDNLVARVSNGEGIVSVADQEAGTKIVDGMAKLPSIADALMSKLKSYKSTAQGSGLEETHATGAIRGDQIPDRLVQQVDKLVPGFSNLNEELKKAFIFLSDLTVTKSSDLNQAARSNGTYRGKDFTTGEGFLKEWNASPDGFGNAAFRAQTAGQLDVGPEIDKAVSDLDVEVGKRIADKIDNGNIDKSVTGWLDKLMEDVTQEIINEFATSGDEARAKVAAGMQARKDMIAVPRTYDLANRENPETGEKFGSAKAFGEYWQGKGELEERPGKKGLFATNLGIDVPVMRPAYSRDEATKRAQQRGEIPFEGYRSNSLDSLSKGSDKETSYIKKPTAKDIKALEAQLEQQAADVGKSGAEGFIEGGKDGLDSHSPSRKMHQVGMDGANGLINGAKEGFAKIPGAPIPGVPATPATGKGIPGAPIPGVPMPSAVPETAKTGFVAKMKGVGSDIASKGLGALATGIEKGKDKVINVAGTALNNYMEAGYRQADAERELSAQRMGLASDILMATDAEYAAMQKAQDAHQKQLMETNQATQEEIDSAVQRSQAMARKREAIAKDIENSKEDLDVIKQRLANAQQADVANDLEAANAQQDGATARQEIIGSAADAKKEARRNRNAKLQRGLGGATMAVGAVSAAASQLPGQYGAGLGGAGGAISAGLGVASMLPGPWGLALGAIVALGTAAFQVNEAMNKAREEAYKFARAMGTGKDAINKFAEFTGKATATEIMDKKREAKTGMFEIQPGKRTFGQSYFESEAGKGLRSSAAQSISTVGAEQSATLMANQLSTAVASGALNAKEARSIAGQLGQELGDMSFGINVVAQMNQLIGPDGENLTNGQALDVRTRMIDKGQEQLKTQSANVNKNVGNAMASSYKSWDFASNMMGDQKDSLLGKIVGNSALGGISKITAGIAAGVTYFTSMGTEMGALQAGYQNQMEMEQQLVDSMDLEYQKKIEALKTQGKINEALELQQTYEQQRAKLVDQQGETVTANMDAYDAAGWIGQGNLGNSVNDAIKSKFKDSVPEAALNKFVDDLTNADIDNRTEYGIKSAVSTGQMGMQQATMASQLFANNDANTALQGKDLEAMMGKGGMGVEATNQALGLASLLKNPEQQAAFMVKFKGLDNKEAQPILDALEEVKKTGKVFDAEAIVNFYTTNTGEAKKVKEDIDKLKEASKKATKITIDMVAKETNPEVADAIRNDAEYFNGLDKDQQIIYTQTIDTMMRMKTDPKFKANYQSWLAAGNSGTEQDYINFLARQETVLGSDTTTPPAGNNNNNGGGGGPTAHWTDDYVKKLRNFAYANQKVTTGINASVKALKNFAKAGKASFSGLSEQLRAAGASEQMISHILEDEAKNIKRFFKNGKLTAEGLKVQARIYQATIAEAYDKQMSAAKVSQSQATAMRKLSTAGVGYALASEMIADAQLAQAIAASKDTAEINKLIAAYKKAQIEAYKAREATREGRAENDINLADKKIAAIQAQVDQYQTGLDMMASQEEEINKTYDKRIKALDKVLEINQDIAQAQKDQLDMAGALSSGDIFAAAKLMSQQKSEQVQKASEKQRQALEDAREYQIKNLQVEINGVLLTREEIDTRIKTLNDQILKIKHDEIDANKIILAQSALIEEQKLAAASGNTSADNSSTTTTTGTTTTTTTGGSGNGGGSGGSGGSGGGGAKKVNPKWTTANNAYKAAKKDADDAAASVKNMESRIAGYEAQIKNRSGSPDILEAARKTLASLKTNLPWTKRGAAEFARIAANKLAARNAIKQYLSTGGPAVNGMFARGVDVIPAMLKPGEFVMSTSAVQQYGTDTMQAINEGRASLGGSSVGIVNEVNSPVYNINVAVKSSEASPQEIAAAVMLQIKSNEKRNG